MAKLMITTKDELELNEILSSLVPTDEEVKQAELEIQILEILMEVM